MSKGWFLIPLLLLNLSVHAEDWPGEQWPSGPTPSGPAIEALAQYAFPPRDDASREGIRTDALLVICLLYTSPSPRDRTRSRMPSSA